MIDSLLTIKLNTPSVPSKLVPRQRLIEQLDAGMDRKLTLVSAPTGFGKTTLLSEWIASCDRPTAWIALDKGDNDPARFWAYVVAALQRVHPGIGRDLQAAIQSPPPLRIESLLADLINEVAAEPSPFILVLDDYHVITSQQVNDAMIYLVDNLPPPMHLVISSRTDPPWPLARLRARREMTELRIRDLSFTPDEAATFLNDVMGLQLSADDVSTLDDRTEGWVAGLQLAALSMQGRDDTASFISAFSGGHRFVVDYLIEEVLDRQPRSTQTFLLQTSILERMTGPLCDAVTGREDSQRQLEMLERANLFVVPLDDERRWYRYHHLFADLLRSRMEQAQDEPAVELHRRAAAWCEENGLLNDAADHALAAGDFEAVARLVEENALPMVRQGELITLLGWLDALPDEAARSWPWLCVASAWVLVYTGRLDDVERHLQDAEQALEHLKGDADFLHVAGHIAALRAYAVALRGDPVYAAELAREALALLPEDEQMTRGLIATILSSALRWSGELDAASEACREAIDICQAAGEVNTLIDALCDLASLQMLQGALHRSAETCRQALALADQATTATPAKGRAAARLSAVLREWNELDAARRYALEGVALGRQRGQDDELVRAVVELARILQADGAPDEALETIRSAREIATRLPTWHIDHVTAWEARLRLMEDDVPAATRWANGLAITLVDPINFQQAVIHLTLAQVAIAEGGQRPGRSLEAAMELLERFGASAEGAGAIGYVIETLILRALALETRGEAKHALAVLEQAFDLAEPEGYTRVFLDHGARIERPLRRAVAQEVGGDTARQLLAALEEEMGDEAPLAPPPATPVLDPLSERELEVLQLLTSSLSSAGMAEELFISVNTVRSHLQSIYSKLDVHSRYEAVARAKELGLL